MSLNHCFVFCILAEAMPMQGSARGLWVCAAYTGLVDLRHVQAGACRGAVASVQPIVTSA